MFSIRIPAWLMFARGTGSTNVLRGYWTWGAIKKESDFYAGRSPLVVFHCFLRIIDRRLYNMAANMISVNTRFKDEWPYDLFLLVEICFHAVVFTDPVRFFF